MSDSAVFRGVHSCGWEAVQIVHRGPGDPYAIMVICPRDHVVAQDCDESTTSSWLYDRDRRVCPQCASDTAVQEYVEELSRCCAPPLDPETAHVDADGILVELLRVLRPDDTELHHVLDLYESMERWYA